MNPDTYPRTPPYLPTESEIARLPRWAKVAFTARCARRVLPVVHLRWPAAPASLVQRLENAVLMAEFASPEAAPFVPDVNKAVAAKGAAAAVNSVYHAGHGNTPYLAARVVSDAAAISVLDAIDSPRATVIAASAANLTGAVLREYVKLEGITAVVRKDFDKLYRACREERFNDATPVPPGFFDDLWPSDVAGSLPAALGATERLKELMGRYAADATVEWSFSSEPFPLGLRIRVEAWGIARMRGLTWGGLTDPRNVDAVLALLWSSVLGIQIEKSAAVPLALEDG